MTKYTTADVAQKLGIGKQTIHRWMWRKEEGFPEPERLQTGAKSVFLWSERDVQRLIAYKEKHYGKGRGNKTPRKKK